MIGIDAAGKTTILYRLKLGERITTIPTIGFNCETVAYNNFTMTIWDVSGGGKLPFLWRHYFEDTVGVIFVVDSNDTDRIGEVKGHLWRVLNELNEMGLQRTPLLVYANKQDRETSMTVAETRDALDLNSIEGREWHIQGTCALDGDGLKEGLDWYIAQVRAQ
ncbi:MAG: hypothetical protein J3Q66DRAFT_332555 [Benniella sp.]|nr:MAG: hypothetical protein J3Q66DRAFT_332555 [Benniella sp.]